MSPLNFSDKTAVGVEKLPGEWLNYFHTIETLG
jgi:hypothetical protein